MFEKEDLEAVLVATPLWSHAAGGHRRPRRRQARAVREDDGLGRAQLSRHGRGRRARTERILEIGYQRFYNPTYHASYEGLLKKGMLGDVFYIRNVWHRNASWRRDEKPPSAGLRSQAVGLRELGAPGELAAVQEALARVDVRAGQPPAGGDQLVLRGRARGGLFVGRRLPLQGRARGAGPHLRHLRIPGGPHGDLHIDPVERLRRLLRADHGHQGHAHPERARPRPIYFPEGTATDKPTNLEVSKRSANAIVDASESRTADVVGGRTVTPELQREVRPPDLLQERDQRLLRRHPHRHPGELRARTRHRQRQGLHQSLRSLRSEGRLSASSHATKPV